MDFVLDLVSPNVLPNRTPNLGYQQWIHQGNLVIQEATGVTLTGVTYPQYFLLATTGTSGTTAAGPIKPSTSPGSIIEFVLDGTNQTGYFNALNQLAQFQAGATGLNATTLASGAKIYGTVVVTGNYVNQAASIGPVILLTTTLSDAIALAGSVTSNSAATSGTVITVNAALASRQQTGSIVLTLTNAFYRVLVDTAKSLSNA